MQDGAKVDAARTWLEGLSAKVCIRVESEDVAQ